MSKSSIIGYGEDFLTFWAITKKIDEFKVQLDEVTNTQDWKVIYRPSFGRAGGIDSAQFGEFDSIIITPKKGYLIESKWDRSSIPNGVLKLNDIQLLRHEILTWYHNNWKGENWDSFVESNRVQFSNTFEGKLIAPTGSLLSKNLQTILSLLHEVKQLEDVLLFLYKKKRPLFDIPERFKKVIIKYIPTYDNFMSFSI